MIRAARRTASCLVTLVAAGGPLVAQTMPVAQQFENLHFRSIGPATMSGRIADLAIYEKNPAIWYVGTAHGGVWKTTSNGVSWTPLLQDRGLLSIGDVTVSQSNPDVLYVGTGESNNRQSISWGDGVWKTADGGKTFEHLGLRESKAIHRIVIDPTNDDIVLVAATGSLWGPGGERGVYKTIDGGKSWKRVLFVDDETGASDLVMSPTDPKVLYASMYQRRRTNCCVNGGGPGSGIWKSIDGGETWTKLTSGIPAGPLGRIGLDAYRKNGNIVYASIEGPSAGRGGRGAAPVPEGEEPPVAGGGAGGGRGGAGQGGASTTGLYRSDDGGATWRRVSTVNPRPLYFSKVRIDPNDPETVYMGGVGMQMTIDGGRTMETDATFAIHDDVHAIWVDPANSDHLVVGNDGGLGVSYDKAKTWQFIPNLPVGLFYHVNYDMSYPFNVCGGMQDNYDWCGPSASRHRAGIMNYDWHQVQGGDGFVTIPDRRDARWVYTESQDGNITRRNRVTGESKSIRPTPQNVTPATPAGESFRFHWDTPMIVSPVDPGLLIVAANKVFVSRDRGDSWTAVSPDLTGRMNRDTVRTMGVLGTEIRNSTNDGISQFPALVSLAESPKQAGVYYTGSDDGVVSVSRDAGKTWQNITKNIPGFPQFAYVSEVVPSAFDAATVYVTVDNHRWNDFKPYIWVSNDFGQTFRSIVGNLSGEVVRTLTEDQRNRDVLYIGTETGIFLSLDRGQSWSRLKANFPTVRVDEITLHPRDNAMIVASHGRALWILDHLEPIQEYTAAQAADAKLFSVPTALQWKMKDDRNDEFWGHQFFVGENPPEAAVIQYFLKSPAADPKIRITDALNRPVRELAIPAAKNAAGIQTVCWDMRGEPIVVPVNAEAGGGRGGAGGGGRGGAGGGRGGNPAVPGVPGPLPTAGYMPEDPCAAPGGGGGGGGGGRGAGGGIGGPAPFVVPGTYTVALVAGGKVVESKPMKIVGDPDVKFAAGQAERYNTIVTDLHAMQRRAANVAVALDALHPQMADAAKKVSESSAIPANVKSQFEALTKDYEAVRKKFGVPTNVAPAGGRGGGRGGAPVDPENVLGRTAALKNAAIGIWEPLSPSMSRAYTDVKLAVPKAIADANALLTRAAAVSTALGRYDITLTVPPVPR